jgi:hypothetical protein
MSLIKDKTSGGLVQSGDCGVQHDCVKEKALEDN